MPDKKIKGSLAGIVDKMNKTYNGLIGEGFSPGIGRRIVPVMENGGVEGWKMQRQEGDGWMDLDGKLFRSMEELIAYYKRENEKKNP